MASSFSTLYVVQISGNIGSVLMLCALDAALNSLFLLGLSRGVVVLSKFFLSKAFSSPLSGRRCNANSVANIARGCAWPCI